MTPPVPILNQPHQVVVWYSTVIFKCNCRPTILSLVICTGVDNPSVCGNCGKQFIVKGIQQDGEVQFGTMLPRPALPPM